MLKIAICDDDEKLCFWIKQAILVNEDEIAQRCHLSIYTSGEALCKALAVGERFDVVFLDIVLSKKAGLDGVAVGRYIRETVCDYTARIVYISNMTEYALDLFEYQPFNFLVKPLDTARVIDTLKKVINVSMDGRQSFQFLVGRQCYVVKCSDIIYAVSMIRKIELHTTDGVYEFYGSLSEMRRCLPEADFALVHQSYLINWNHVRRIEADKVRMSDSSSIPMSRTCRKDVRSQYLRRMRGLKCL